MLVVFFILSLILTKQLLALEIENKIFYNDDELKKLQFTFNINNYKGSNIIEGNAPDNSIPPVYVNYGYESKHIHDIIPLNNSKYLQNYFVNAKEGSCEYILNNYKKEDEKTNETFKKCMEKTFCGVHPKNIKETQIPQNNIDGIYCVRIFNETIYVFFVSNIKKKFSDVVFEEIFFYKAKNEIDCQSKKIHILYSNVYSESCYASEVTKKIEQECKEKNKCTISFEGSLDAEHNYIPINTFKGCVEKNFYVHILYKCKEECKTTSPIEECHKKTDNTTYKTCSYGYKKIEPEGRQDTQPLVKCEEHNLCFGKKCNLNQYCNETTKTCSCFENLSERDGKCLYKNFCEKLNCPAGSTCVEEDGKLPECKCTNENILYRNKCYTESELKTAMQKEPAHTDVIFRDHIYTKSAINYEYIFLECPSEYTIEVLQATSTCLGVHWGEAKMRYITDIFINACNKKETCQLSYHINDSDIPKIINVCNDKRHIYKYTYICKAKQTLDKNFQPISSTNSTDDRRVAVFSGSFNSTLTCDGGKIQIHKAELITEENCPSISKQPTDELTETIKKYCNDLTDCNVGLIYQFDRYCSSGSLLYISYNCTLFDNTCSSNYAVPIGNKHKHICVCKNPNFLEENQEKCQIKTTEADNICATTEKFRKIKIMGLSTSSVSNTDATVDNGVNSNVNDGVDAGICECKEDTTNINGLCVDNSCNLRCPLNKICKVTTEPQEGKQCVCPDDAPFDGEQCKCSGTKIIRNGKCVEEDLCLGDEPKCTGENEKCVYDRNNNTYRCECKEHYKRANTENGPCVEIDYCENVTCQKNERCVVTNHKATCVCDGEFEKINEECVYIDKCKNNAAVCPSDATCIYHKDKPYECQCKKGFYLEDNLCLPEDKCSSETLCPENSICVNLANHEPLCLCTFNYLKKDGQCVIRNQCLTNNGGCDKNAICRMNGDKVECICKENYQKQSNDPSKCIPKIKRNDRSFHFPHNKDPIVILGNCGLLHFNTSKNEIVWKIKNTEETYVFTYIYPSSGNVEVTIRNEELSSTIYVKKKNGSDIIYDDFHVNHYNCSYSHWFFYLKSEQKMFVL